MDPIAQDLLAVVRPVIGYREKNGQRTKFGEWYAKHIDPDPVYKNAPWCDMFIAWAADKAGLRDYVGTFAWTPSHARWFERQGAWSDRPEPGALVFFDWSGSKDIKKIDHVGIVERVEGGRIHTIEANVDRVWLKRKVRDESKVVGYGLPRKVKENLEARAKIAVSGPTVSIDSGRPDAGFKFFGAPVETLPLTALLVVVGCTAFIALRVRGCRLAAAKAVTSKGRHRRAARGREPVAAGSTERSPERSTRRATRRVTQRSTLWELAEKPLDPLGMPVSTRPADHSPEAGAVAAEDRLTRTG
ncbi:CHAP domain-containing protein [Thermopolyspora sp. NPDC052614]|uniref:CHAP domain-containing protein n=1 Tax=Thermopolyspora sp. NPDC052614 TaxID=3155682 RepID=UPI00343A74A2